jgi:tetratricopeptide (TPR) repeat protein
MFSKAEKLFIAKGDQRDALYARLGSIRAKVDRPLPTISAQLAAQLGTNPLLQKDKQLRMFCLIVKGDIDGEMNSGAMRSDWQQVQTLARELGDKKWQYRSLAQLGLVAFYEGDLATARMNVGTAVAAATAAGDAGAEIRYLTVLGIGLMRAKMYEQAFPYFDKALKISDATPDAGYPFVLSQSRIEALTGLSRFEEAQRLQANMLAHARALHQSAQEAAALRDKLPRVAMPDTKPKLFSALAQFLFRDKSVMLLTQGLGQQPFHGNVAILANEFTNSAAEMVTGFAAENRLATVIGTKTAGNVLGAANFAVGEGYWLRLPIFGWYTSNGDCLEGKGVSPNLPIEADVSALNMGVDKQMSAAALAMTNSALSFSTECFSLSDKSV